MHRFHTRSPIFETHEHDASAPLSHAWSRRKAGSVGRSAISIPAFGNLIEKRLRDIGGLLECRTNRDDRLGDHEVVNASEILKMVLPPSRASPGA